MLSASFPDCLIDGGVAVLYPFLKDAGPDMVNMSCPYVSVVYLSEEQLDYQVCDLANLLSVLSSERQTRSKTILPSHRPEPPPPTY